MSPLAASLFGGIFIVTTFTASSLLFLIQPMFAKMALPQLGGSPSVWNTCVLFFQATLLLAYLYAHVTVKYLGARLQAMSHLALLLLPLIALPVSAPGGAPAAGESPTYWLLRSMTITVGLPFFCVATMAPLIQRWFAVLPVRSAADPYFLYAASNLGSMLALIAFPLWLEPAYGVRAQASGWVVGYAGLLVLTAACVLAVWMRGSRTSSSALATAESHDAVTHRDRWFWVVVSFVPSSLMLGVTTHISTDLAAVPLLWILPLALYLATFIVAFSGARRAWYPALNAALPFLVLAGLASVVLRMASVYLIPFHVAVFFACALVCHLRLAASRPSAEHLTEFYLWLSFGGVLGGVFNTLIAPHIFDGIYEYTLVLALACWLREPRGGNSRPEPWAKFAVSATVPLAICLIAWAVTPLGGQNSIRQVLVVVTIVVAGFWGAATKQMPFNIAVVALAIVPMLPGGQLGSVLFADRSFFGVMKVLDVAPQFHLLQHGTTLHGQQDMTDPEACHPLSYYHRNGPIGQVFETFSGRFSRIAVVGLGSGAIACYAQPGDEMTFLEIDPLVERIATDARLFTFMRNSGGDIKVAIGDGRKLLEAQPHESYDLIIIDAFSSDSVPIHLLTTEAFTDYAGRLRPGGALALHISNRYLDLEPVVAATSAAARLRAVANRDLRIPGDDENKGRSASHWIVASPDESILSTMVQKPGWYRLSAGHVRPWTDDFSNIIDALNVR